jgi:hypothetical protein
MGKHIVRLTGRPFSAPGVGGGGKRQKKREASQERPPLLNEPVGGRLIGVLYCRISWKSFQFLC